MSAERRWEPGDRIRPYRIDEADAIETLIKDAREAMECGWEPEDLAVLRDSINALDTIRERQ